MKIQDIQNALETAYNAMFVSQPNLFKFTPETGLTEWNLAHHYANEVHRLYDKYNCDLDVTKHTEHNKRPDIILHERGTHENNFLVIDVKYNRHPREIEEDVVKIHNHWFQPPLFYTYGATLHIQDNQAPEIQVFMNPAK